MEAVDASRWILVLTKLRIFDAKFLNFKNSNFDQRSSLQIHMRFNARGQEWRRIAQKAGELNYFLVLFQ